MIKVMLLVTAGSFLLCTSASNEGRPVCIPITANLVCNSTCNQCTGRGLCDQVCTYCGNGYFGTDCSLHCDGNCLSSKCRLLPSGNAIKCLDGCEPGWMGLMCNTKCMYTCSKCRQNGECTECKEGYYGHGCKNVCHQSCQKCQFRKGTCTEYTIGKVKNGSQSCFESLTNISTAQPPSPMSITNTDSRMETSTFENNTSSKMTNGITDIEGSDISEDNNDGLLKGLLTAISILCLFSVGIIIGFALRIYKRKRQRDVSSIPVCTDYLTPTPQTNIYDEIDDSHIPATDDQSTHHT